MDSAQWTQEFGVAKNISMPELAHTPISACSRPASVMERKLVRPQKDQAVNCPRCHSTNTKFCYYNNYSLTQPRYFCKTCRRYWTEGGTLRNVPVGGGSRKNKRSTNSISNPSSMVTDQSISSQKSFLDLNPPTISQFSSQNPKVHDNIQGQDLNLGFQGHHDFNNHHGIPQFLEFPKIEGKDVISSSSSSTPISALNFLRNGNIGARGLNSFIPMAPISGLDQTSALLASGFTFQEYKPSLGFNINDGISNGSGYGINSTTNVAQENDINGTLMFTLGATKRHSSTSHDQGDQEKGQENTNGYWNGMLGGGSW